MNQSQVIKARIELPCTIRFYEKGLGYTRGITEELSRESLVVIAHSTALPGWLNKLAHISVGIELPHAHEFRPRVLECAAIVSEVGHFGNGLRISAKISRMSFKDREPDQAVPAKFAAVASGFRPWPRPRGRETFNQ